jgi:hypothetical protein
MERGRRFNPGKPQRNRFSLILTSARSTAKQTHGTGQDAQDAPILPPLDAIRRLVSVASAEGPTRCKVNDNRIEAPNGC